MGRTLTLARGTVSPGRTLDTVAPGSSRVVTQYHGTARGASIAAAGAEWVAQTFTVKQPCALNEVRPVINRIGLPGTATVSIRRTGAQGKPTGGDLGSASFNANDLPVGTWTGGQSTSLKLNAPIKLASGSRYAIVLRAPTGDPNAIRRINWPLGTSAQPYPDGGPFASTNSGDTWSAQSDDLRFDAFGNIVPSRDLDP